MSIRIIVATALALTAGTSLASAQDTDQSPRADFMEKAEATVAKFSKANPPFEGPKDGPKAEAGKTIVFVSTDQRNGGARGVGEAVEEAGKAVGWDVRTIDGQGTVSGRASAMTQAMSLKPDVIVLGGIDGNEQSTAIDQADKSGIKVIGWHSTAKAGPHPELKIFTDITTDPLEVAEAAASYAIVDSDGKAGAVIFTDSTYKVAVAKSDAMAEVIKACTTCALIEVIDTPLSDTSIRMPPMTSNLLIKYGDKFTHALSINDLTFDFMAPALASAGVEGDGNPRNISAGDGSGAAFERIRSKQFQIGTVAEPLRLQGWQIVDEANRAINGEEASGYIAPPHLFTPDNISEDGGADNQFDPENGYREAYQKIWGVE